MAQGQKPGSILKHYLTLNIIMVIHVEKCIIGKITIFFMRLLTHQDSVVVKTAPIETKPYQD